MSSSIKTPSEKVIEILAEFKDYFDNTEIISDLEWTIKMIASNKLYEPVLNEGGEKGDLVIIFFHKIKSHYINKFYYR